MTNLLVLIAIIVVPILVLAILRINATLVFMSLCLGYVLSEFVGSQKVNAQGINLSGATLHLVLLLAPVALTAVFMIRTVHGGFRLALNVLPAVGVGVLGALMAIPFLPTKVAYNFISLKMWHQLTQYQTAIVVACAVVCLLVLWLQRPKTGEKKHGKHKD